MAASALAVPYLVPSGVLHSAERAGANDRIGIGYIGAGRRAGQLTDLPRGAQIVAVADCNLPSAAKMAEKFACRAHQYFKQLLDSDDVHAVIVATPDHWHILPSVEACKAGKDVYCEKPLTLTIREGRQLVNAARANGDRVVQTGSQQRSMAANRFGCELVRNGAIGRVKKVLAANFESPWECALPEQPVPQGLDWNIWCGQTDVVPYHIDLKTPRANPGWISFRPWSGGEMTGWGSHGFDQIQWALGTCLTGPVEVWIEGEPFRPPTYTQPDSIKRGNEICSTPLVRMRYRINDNDVVMELGDGPRGGGKFIGENGTIIIDRAHVRSEPKEIVAEAMKTHHFQPGGDTPEHLANWIECVKSRKRPVADVEIGHRSTTVCHLGNIARWIGRRLTWDPESESFVGDDEANTFLARRQREPYRIPDET